MSKELLLHLKGTLQLRQREDFQKIGACRKKEMGKIPVTTSPERGSNFAFSNLD